MYVLYIYIYICILLLLLLILQSIREVSYIKNEQEEGGGGWEMVPGIRNKESRGSIYKTSNLFIYL